MPPFTTSGRKSHVEQNEDTAPLMTEQIAAAMAEGKLEEFLKDEIPDNDYARNLVSMMMGMTGMLPSESVSSPPAQPPEDVLKAAQSGDVKGLMELLKREYGRHVPGALQTGSEKSAVSPDEKPIIEKEIIDQLIKIASDNNATLDWLVLRAIKLYVEEYIKTGRL